MKEASELTSENRHPSHPLPWQKYVISIHQQSQVNSCKGLSTDRCFSSWVFDWPTCAVWHDL